MADWLIFLANMIYCQFGVPPVQHNLTHVEEHDPDWALRWVVVIAVPATVALYLLATPLLTTIFQYNAFTTHDVAMSATALQAFAVGVCGFIFVKVLAPGFFARQDTQTPMRIAVASVVVNVVLSLILVRYLAHTGLALAISIAAWVNAFLLFVVLLRRGVFKPQAGWLWFFLRIAIAVTLMGVCLVMLDQTTQEWFEQGLMQRVGHLSVLVAAGAGVYFLALLILGIRPQQLLLRPR